MTESYTLRVMGSSKASKYTGFAFSDSRIWTTEDVVRLLDDTAKVLDLEFFEVPDFTPETIEEITKS